MTWLYYTLAALAAVFVLLGALYRVIDPKHWPSSIRPVAANAWKFVAGIGGVVAGLMLGGRRKSREESNGGEDVVGGEGVDVDAPSPNVYEKPEVDDATGDNGPDGGSGIDPDYWADPAGDGSGQ